MYIYLWLYIYVCVLHICKYCIHAWWLRIFLVQSKSKSLSPQEVPFSSKFRKGFKTAGLMSSVPITPPPTAEATEWECSCHNTNTERCAGSICWCWKIENFTSPVPSCQVEISSFAFVCPSPLRFLAAEIHPCASWTTSNGWISWKNTTCSRVCPVTATPHPRFESGVWSERTQPDALTIAMRLNPEPRDGIFQERILAV